MTTPRQTLALIGIAVALAIGATPALAVYKVVGPDGKVTYTDTPPAAGSNARVQAVAIGSGGEAPNLSGVPYEVQQAATKYPVTLYASRDCQPCDIGRQLLQQRGIPYTERVMGTSAADTAAMQRLTGSSTVPALTVGQQQIKGGATVGEWHSYLDAAGYPRESKLPASYRAPVATPLVTAADAPPATATAATAANTTAAPATDTPAPIRAASGPNIRF